MGGRFVISAGVPALFGLSLSLLAHLPGEEAGPEAKPEKLESKLPSELAVAFDVPAGPKDAHGNAIRQGADEKTGWPLEIRHKAMGMHLVFIPAGEFSMGSPENEKDRGTDEKQHKVTLAKPFYMAKYEVTVGQFKAFARAATYRTDAEKDGWAVAWTGSSWGKVDDASWQKPGFEQTEDHPVTEVSWNDGKAFCEWMSKAGTAKVSLPSEAQWEYACRAGSKGRFFWGEEETKAGQYANVADKTGKAKFSNWTIFDTDDGYVFTSPVGKFRANDFGLYDMTGNVWEWCEDTYGDYDKAPTDGTSARNDANDASRVLRGGSWDVNPQDARSACRYRGRPDDRNFLAGFRVVVACEWLR